MLKGQFHRSQSSGLFLSIYPFPLVDVNSEKSFSAFKETVMHTNECAWKTLPVFYVFQFYETLPSYELCSADYNNETFFPKFVYTVYQYIQFQNKKNI